jgi:hypothetical protein
MDQEPDVETESDTISLEETLSSLKRNANAVETHFQESLKHLKAFQQKLAKDSKDITEVPLQPKTRLMKWLTDRGLPVESTFEDFFEAFVQDHTKEHRLDLTTRSLRLNPAACILFGYKDTNPWVPVYDLLEKLNVLYY